jgi:hypothetical protein
LPPILDRVLRSKPTHHDPKDLETFRRWLHGYMCKLGRDASNQPTPNAHPPDNDLVAQFLAVAEPRRLGTMLDALLLEKQPAFSYAWFVTVALQRVHGITWQETKKARSQLRVVKHGQARPAAESGEFAAGLLTQATAGVKKLR